MAKGIVYVATNQGIPGLVKVGICKGDRLDARMANLSRHTGVPFPFECEYAALLDDYKSVERRVLSIFKYHRPNRSREFLEVSPEAIIDLLGLFPHEDVTSGQDYSIDEADQQALDNLRRAEIQRDRIDCVIAAINERENPNAFEEVFIGENCWRSLAMSRPQREAIEWFALYQVRPQQEVTHIAKVSDIVESSVVPSRWQLNFDGTPQKLEQPIPHGDSPTPDIQGRRYCNKSALLKSESLTELFSA